MPTTDLTPGTVTTLGSLRPGDDPTIEQTVRRVLAAAVADGIATCARDPMTMTTGELVGPANALSAAMGEQQRRVAKLEAQVRTLREAMKKNRVHCHCEDPMNCDLCERSAAVLAATAPKENR